MGEVNPHDKQYPLDFEDGPLLNPGGVHVPIPIADLWGKSSIDSATLAQHAIQSIPPDFPDALKEAGTALAFLEEQKDTPTLPVVGPFEGDYYVTLPLPDEHK